MLIQVRTESNWGAAYDANDERGAYAAFCAQSADLGIAVEPFEAYAFVRVSTADLARQDLIANRVEAARVAHALRTAAGEEARYLRDTLADLADDARELRREAAKAGVAELLPADWRVPNVPPQLRPLLHLVEEAFDGASPTLRA